MSESESIEFFESKGADASAEREAESEEAPGVDSPPPAPQKTVRKSVIDLSLGLEELSPVKVKRGSIDLSLGLSYEEPEQKAKSSVPSSLLKYGLERQGSLENGAGEGTEELSPELLELLQSSVGESSEAWEDKVDERKRSLVCLSAVLTVSRSSFPPSPPQRTNPGR
jgi:hypothetical protein